MQKRLIYILGGGLSKEKDGSWQTTSYFEGGDTIGVLGDRIRIDAGAYRFIEDPENTVLMPSGGFGYNPLYASTPTISSVMKKELLSLGVLETAIIEENESNSTFEQLQAVIQLKNSKKYGTIEILTNRYHVDRVRAMIIHLPELKELRDKEVFVSSAEEISLEHDMEKWKTIIEKAYSSKGLLARIASEKKGIKDLENGKYIIRRK